MGTPIKTFDELIIAADAHLENDMHVEETPHRVIEMDETFTGNANNLTALAHLANQLVEDADRRKAAYPEEKVLC